MVHEATSSVESESAEPHSPRILEVANSLLRFAPATRPPTQSNPSLSFLSQQENNSVLLKKKGVNNTKMAPQLKAYIDDLNNIALPDAIQAIAELFPDLTGSVSLTCVYLIQHPDYEGETRLNDLGRIFLACARRCTKEHASF